MGCGSSQSRVVDEDAQEEEEDAALDICNGCGAYLKEGANFCGQCGKNQSETTMTMREALREAATGEELPSNPHVDEEQAPLDPSCFPCKLKVTAVSASGLRIADTALLGRGSSDPYCTCQIIGKPETGTSTRHIDKTLEPVWDEEMEISDFGMADSLEFCVWDYDKYSDDDLLGRVNVPGKLFLNEGAFSGSLRLFECGKKEATLAVKIEVVPARPPALPVSKPGSRLRVVLMSASGLRAADWSITSKAKSDPYCTCQLAGKVDSYVETRHLAKTLDPVWYEEHIIDDYELGDHLEFTVMDWDRTGSNDLLGRAKLDCGEFDREDGFDGELDLKECGKGHKAKLKVQIEVLPPALPDAPPVSVQGSTLAVSIVGASGLRAADWSIMGGKSDPFCRVEIKGRPEATIETKYMPKTLEPAWDEVHELQDFQQGDNLEFSVWDHNGNSNADLLGRVTLRSREYDREDGFAGELKLKECGKGKVATLRVNVWVVAQEVEDLAPISEPGSRLRVVMVGAVGLRSSSGIWGALGDTPDPFCICCIPGKTDSEIQTRYLSNTLEPCWNEEHEVLDYEQGDNLQFSIMDYNKLSAPTLLGQATVAGWRFDREGGFDGDVRLKERPQSGKKHPGPPPVLSLKIDILPPLRAAAPAVSQPGSSLEIVLRGARGLRSADWSLVGKSSSDPYCTCQIIGKPDSLFKTRHIQQTLEPQWEEEHVIETFDRGDELQFQVFDWDRVGSPDSLGIVKLHSREYDREDGFDGEIRLRESGKGRIAFLDLKVQVVPPEAPDEERPPVSEPGGRLKIIVDRASGLRAADWSFFGGKSDPYCLCRIPGKPDAEFSTRHISKNLDPVWEEEHEIDEFDPGDDLEFVVMDHDRTSSADLLGRRTLPSFRFDRDGGFDGELRLKECGKGKIATLTVRVLVLPPLTPSAPSVSEPGSRLRVKILSASGLRAADFALTGGSSDPFCCCQLLGKPETRFETRVVEKCLEPVWDEERIMSGFDRDDRLQFTIFDKDRGPQNALLGRITLAGREFDRESGFSGSLKLKACGKKNEAFLRVQVVVLPSVETEQRLLEEARELERERQSEARERDMMAFAERDQFEREAAAREQALREQEEAAREAERRAKEAARRHAEEEAARKAAIKARHLAEVTEILVTVQPVYAPGEVLAEIITAGGKTVDHLANLVFDMSRLPLKPRLSLGSEFLAMNEKLIDVGVTSGEPVMAQMSAVLTASEDCSAKVWDALTGDCLYTLQGHTKPVCMVRSVPDLKFMVTCSEDSTAKLHVVQRDQKAATCLFTLTGHSKAVNSVEFSYDHKWIVTGSEDCTAKIWSVRTGECKRTFDGHRAAVISASFTPDGLKLCTKSEDLTEKIFEVDSGRCTHTAPLSDRPDMSSASTSDGQVIATIGGSSVQVKDVGGDSEISLEGHSANVVAVACVDVRVPARANLSLLANVQRSPTNSLRKPLSPTNSSKKLSPKNEIVQTLNSFQTLSGKNAFVKAM